MTPEQYQRQPTNAVGAKRHWYLPGVRETREVASGRVETRVEGHAATHGSSRTSKPRYAAVIRARIDENPPTCPRVLYALRGRDAWNRRGDLMTNVSWPPRYEPLTIAICALHRTARLSRRSGPRSAAP
jgi:hypothetical protein